MNTAVPMHGPRRRWRTTVLLASTLLGCATASRVVSAQALPTSFETQIKRSVQAVPLPANGAEDQTSWIIEPDVPRIPKLPGVNAKLPPHIERRMSYAFDLAQRGAIYTSNSEFRSVLGLCALELDSREGGTRHREALRVGLAALDKSDDFDVVGSDRHSQTDSYGGSTIDAAGNAGANTVSAVDPIQEVQARYAYAEQHLSYACEGMPGASLAFYGLGRTMVDPGSRTVNAVAKAAVLQQTALTVAPQNVLAGNELGVLLAEHGQLDEAEKMFRQCVAIDPTPEAWRNLAVVYARKGDQVASRSAHAEADLVAKSDRSQAKIPAAESVAGAAPAATTLTQAQFSKNGSTDPTSRSSDSAADPASPQSKPGLMGRLNISWMLPSSMRR
jgi:tetratricopeptide (TPR) repeat protein